MIMINFQIKFCWAFKLSYRNFYFNSSFLFDSLLKIKCLGFRFDFNNLEICLSLCFSVRNFDFNNLVIGCFLSLCFNNLVIGFLVPNLDFTLCFLWDSKFKKNIVVSFQRFINLCFIIKITYCVNQPQPKIEYMLVITIRVIFV